jgi:hypothetical protein
VAAQLAASQEGLSSVRKKVSKFTANDRHREHILSSCGHGVNLNHLVVSCGHAAFQVLTAVTMKSTTLWDVTSCSPIVD